MTNCRSYSYIRSIKFLDLRPIPLPIGDWYLTIRKHDNSDYISWKSTGQKEEEIIFAFHL